MERQSISLKLKYEGPETVEYYYEGAIIRDFSNAGVFEFDKKILKSLKENLDPTDFTLRAASFLLNNQMRIIKLCNYPLISENGEDYHAIYAFAYILERYFHSGQLQTKLFCLSKSDLEFLKYEKILSH